jgi:hypothetical protein
MKEIAFLVLTISFLGCKYEPQPTAERAVISAASLQPQMTFRLLRLSWTHPNPAALSGFKIQYSTHHSPWVDYTTVANTVFAIENMTQSTVFKSNTTYLWRVIGIGDNQEESCHKSTFLGMGTIEYQVLPANLRLTDDFVVGSNPTFTLATPAIGTPTNINGWNYVLERYNGTAWVTDPATPLPAAASTLTFAIPAPELYIDGKYRIYATKTLGTVTYGSNTIEFYYSPPQTQQKTCL